MEIMARNLHIVVWLKGGWVKSPKSPLGSATVTMIYESQLMASSSKKFFFVLPLSFVISSFSSALLCSLLVYCFLLPSLVGERAFPFILFWWAITVDSD